MTRRWKLLFAVVLAGAVSPAGHAVAQYYDPPPKRGGPPYIEEPRVPPGYYLEDRGDTLLLRRRSDDRPVRIYDHPGNVAAPPPEFIVPDDRRPPPEFAVPDYRRPPPSGHLLDSARRPVDEDVVRPPAPVGRAPSVAPAPVPPSITGALPPEDRPETGEPQELPAHLKRQLVSYSSREPAGTIVVDTANTYLYLVLGNGRALRYGIGVGREGFTWSGRERISKMTEWPDWHPPAEMIERQPYLPRFMAGGEGNPLGARALYLGKTLYRIHGTNQPSTIGKNVSSGCIRLLNKDIEDLYSRVQVGTRVVVLPGDKAPLSARNDAGASAPPADLTPPQSRAVGAGPLPPIR